MRQSVDRLHNTSPKLAQWYWNDCRGSIKGCFLIIFKGFFKETRPSQIRTHDHALHHWPQKGKYSNPWPCTTPPMTPKSQRFEPKTIDLQWPPKVKDSIPRPCEDKIRTQNDALPGMRISRLVGYWPKVTHGPVHFLRARSGATSAIHEWTTNASEVRIPSLVKPRASLRDDGNQAGTSHASVTCCRSSTSRTSHADVVHMMRASCARHSSSKCDVKRRAGSAHHTRCTRREKCAS
jgi:hypothetical protein